MRVAIGSDHGGYELKAVLCRFLGDMGYDVLDLGCGSLQSVDYPAFADAVCRAVISGEAESGILICGTGIGMSIAANRHRQIRAALCHESFTARMSREHNNANVLCLGGRVLGVEVARETVQAWLGAHFQGGRHQRRLDMLS